MEVIGKRQKKKVKGEEGPKEKGKGEEEEDESRKGRQGEEYSTGYFLTHIGPK